MFEISKGFVSQLSYIGCNYLNYVEVGAHSHRRRRRSEPAVTIDKCSKSTTTYVQVDIAKRITMPDVTRIETVMVDSAKLDTITARVLQSHLVLQNFENGCSKPQSLTNLGYKPLQ
jgi:hypothetical protein